MLGYIAAALFIIAFLISATSASTIAVFAPLKEPVMDNFAWMTPSLTAAARPPRSQAALR